MRHELLTSCCASVKASMTLERIVSWENVVYIVVKSKVAMPWWQTSEEWVLMYLVNSLTLLMTQ